MLVTTTPLLCFEPCYYCFLRSTQQAQLTLVAVCCAGSTNVLWATVLQSVCWPRTWANAQGICSRLTQDAIEKLAPIVTCEDMPHRAVWIALTAPNIRCACRHGHTRLLGEQTNPEPSNASQHTGVLHLCPTPASNSAITSPPLDYLYKQQAPHTQSITNAQRQIP
jgi:hypothetical protein